MFSVFTEPKAKKKTKKPCVVRPRRAEEAVNEVKRQAMDEVQKAVAEAEQKAFEMISAERAKMEKTLAEAKRKAQEDAIMVINEQEDSSEVIKIQDIENIQYINKQHLLLKERKVWLVTLGLS